MPLKWKIILINLFEKRIFVHYYLLLLKQGFYAKKNYCRQLENEQNLT